MRRLGSKRNLAVYSALVGLGLGICAWQVEEHLRFNRAEAAALVNRGRDVTSTLGVVVRSQRRFGMVVSRERLQSALQDLVRPDELVGIAILGATGETIASAGQTAELTPEMLRARGIYWSNNELTIMNIMDLGTSSVPDGGATSATIVVSDGSLPRNFRGRPRPPPESDSGRPSESNGAARDAVPAASTPSATSTASSTSGSNAPATPSVANPTGPRGRPPFGRPSWMSEDEYESVIRKQGVHSLVISIATAEMRRRETADLLLRSLVSLLALGAAAVSAFAWRNVAKSADLQIRLARAGEINAHLKERNLAAAGLAHETRNPLNLIRGLAQMITMQTEAIPKLREHSMQIIEEADRVTGQLNEFINYSKPRDAQLAPVDIQRVIGDVLRALLPDLEEKQIEVTPPTTALRIEADEQLLRQMLFNVLLNAVQALSPAGKIDIRLQQVSVRSAVLDIADNGPGVVPSARLNIFKPYFTMRPKGVGLGLAIVQQIATAHGWEVLCLANEPRGAIFRFRNLVIAPPAL